jgi:hypothetical protein
MYPHDFPPPAFAAAFSLEELVMARAEIDDLREQLRRAREHERELRRMLTGAREELRRATSSPWRRFWRSIAP